MIDVLITSYNTISSDYRQMEDDLDAAREKRPQAKKKRRAPYVFDVEFHRIVLDEAHTVSSPLANVYAGGHYCNSRLTRPCFLQIRNSKTGYFKSTCALKSERRLCLTGTPTVNNPSDLRSLLQFLEVDPLRRFRVFRKLVLGPIKENRESGLRTIRTTMSFICLRRKKEGLLDAIQLVQKKVRAVRVGWPEGCAHKQTYDVLFNTVRAYFIKLLTLQNGNDRVLEQFMQILALVLRIRQCCNHMGLVPEDLRQSMKDVDVPKLIKAIDNEEGATLFEVLQGVFKAELVECVVCMNELSENDAKVLRSCRHVFCQSCLNQIANHLCPLCRVPYSSDDMVDMQTAAEAAKKEKVPFEAKKELKKHGRSPKFQAILDKIDQMKPDEKGVFFSQWTSCLNLLEVEFKALGHTFTRIGKYYRRL